jgi:hypothetical protein
MQGAAAQQGLGPAGAADVMPDVAIVNAAGPANSNVVTAAAARLERWQGGRAAAAAVHYQQQQEDSDDEWTVEAQDAVVIGDGESDEDDDVIATLSTAFSTKYYTPRHSLAYESRRSSVAVEQATEQQYSGYFDRRPDNSFIARNQTQQQQQQQGHMMPASVAAAAAAAKALLAVPTAAVNYSSTAPAATASKTAAAPVGMRKSNSRLALQQLQPLLESEPHDFGDEESTCYQSAGSNSCRSSSEGCFTAASRAEELEQVLAYHSPGNTDFSDTERCVAAAGPGTGPAKEQESIAHANAQLLEPAQQSLPLSLAAASAAGDLGSLPVQGLLSAVGAPDMAYLTVGELLQALTQAVVQQQQQQQRSQCVS